MGRGPAKSVLPFSDLSPNVTSPGGCAPNLYLPL